MAVKEGTTKNSMDYSNRIKMVMKVLVEADNRRKENERKQVLLSKTSQNANQYKLGGE